MDRINKNLVIGVLLILLIIFGLFWYKNTNKKVVSVVDQTLKCAQLYELKKDKYWGDEIGQSKYIFNRNLNTCLALNIYNNSETKDYFAMVMDMSNDKFLLYYSDTRKGFYVEGDQRIDCKNSYIYFEYLKNGKEVKDYGCEKYSLMDRMFEQIRAFGFEVFDATL
jgi:hypothetical protein